MEETATPSPRKSVNDDVMSSSTLEAPVSPSSSATSCQDITYLPTIDDLVNDFDDEQTLNEEEALAALEATNPEDEIATLREESEMPLEELLAKYQNMPPLPMDEFVEPPYKRIKRSRKRVKTKESNVKSPCDSTNAAPDVIESVHGDKAEDEVEEGASNAEEILITSLEQTEKNEQTLENKAEYRGKTIEESCESMASKTEIRAEETAFEPPAAEHRASIEDESPAEENVFHIQPPEKVKIRRSHLLDLYPEQSFVAVVEGGDGKTIPLEEIYCEDEDDEDDIEDEEEGDGDQTKKTIMIGCAYQATIPEGLSQYGDILPYENEDKLIWEPSQVSEAEVEEYLLKARDIKPTLNDDEVDTEGLSSSIVKGICERADESNDILSSAGAAENQGGENNAAFLESDSGVVKDDEQALHLLVQCGYDFKEALRRKRLNAVPLTGSMSIWSEEECQKFEEGIQKYGKDFLKIRQNLVRTRTMRELVQFYYLWKKSERRDNNFANSDTVDHMDIYLNEGGDYGPTASNSTAFSSLSNSIGMRKANGSPQKSFSIMTGGHNSCNSNANVTGGSSSMVSHHKNINRRLSDGSMCTSAAASHAEPGSNH